MDSGLKKRLLGAAVLVILAIIFVPMLLPDHSGTGSQSVSVKIPPQPSGDMQTRVLQVGPDGASAGSSTAAAVNDPDHVATLNVPNRKPAEVEPAGVGRPTAAAIAAATSTVVTPPAAGQITPTLAPKPAPVAAASAVARPAPPPASSPTQQPSPARPLPGGAGAAAGALYTVNLGIYADHASANKLVANAKRHGFTALASPETFQGKAVLRVTVGPFHSRAEAEAARLKLATFDRVSMSIESTAVTQKGDAPASALATTQPGGWAVQLAAFATQDAANDLRNRLRQQGFDGYVDSITTAKGKLWRVRAGPFASRAAAVSARGQIAQKLKVSGDIVTQR